MTKKNRRITLVVVLLALTAIAVPVGLKFFPFTKVVRMPSAPEQEYSAQGKVRTLPPNAYSYDFEVAPGKSVPGGFYKGLAHSGQYSVKAFGQNSFSNAMERTAEEIGIENLKSVTISAWIYVFPTRKEVKGSLVFTASNELGVNVCWQGIGIREPEVPKGTWFKVSGQFDLTSITFKPGYKVQIYFWNTSSTDILVDDYYAVFGGAPERRGDSARVDLTRGRFTPQFNHPPFPVTFLKKEEPEIKLNPADLNPADLTVAGDLFNTGDDGLFSISSAGKVAAFIYCRDSRTFKKVPVSNPTATTSCGRVKKLHILKSAHNQPDRIVVESEKGWLLGELKQVRQPCQQNTTLQTSLVILSKSDQAVSSLVCGNFTGSDNPEILIVSAGGEWQLLSAVTGPGNVMTWKPVNKSQQNPVKLWDPAEARSTLTGGRFLPRIGHDVVLTVSRPLNGSVPVYSILDFDPLTQRWNSLGPRKHERFGLTMGLDTLKPDDRFFVLKSGSGYRALRYNRDWRFDLKEIRFSDTAFTIISSLDFRGYDKGMNPKFYEKLNLIPLNSGNPGHPAFLVNGSVARERHYESILPDFIHLYSLEPDEKR